MDWDDLNPTCQQVVFDAVANCGEGGATYPEIWTYAHARGFTKELVLRGQVAMLVRVRVLKREIIANVAPTDGRARVRYFLAEHAERPLGRRKSRLRRSRQEVERMLDLFREGKTLQEIATEYSLTRERIRQILAREGATVRRDRTIANLLERVRNLEHQVFGKPKDHNELSHPEAFDG